MEYLTVLMDNIIISYLIVLGFFFLLYKQNNTNPTIFHYLFRLVFHYHYTRKINSSQTNMFSPYISSTNHTTTIPHYGNWLCRQKRTPYTRAKWTVVLMIISCVKNRLLFHFFLMDSPLSSKRITECIIRSKILHLRLSFLQLDHTSFLQAVVSKKWLPFFDFCPISNPSVWFVFHYWWLAIQNHR